MKTLKQRGQISLFISLVLLAALLLGTAFSHAGSVSRASASLDGKNLQLAFVDLNSALEAHLVLADGSLQAEKTGGELLSQAADEIGRPVLAAINAARAAGVEAGSLPQAEGALLQDGKVLCGRCGESFPALAFTIDGKALIDNVKMEIELSFHGGARVQPQSVNCWNAGDDALLLFTEELGGSWILPSPHLAAVLRDGKVTELARVQNLSVAPGSQILLYGSKAEQAAKADGTLPAVGDSVEYSVFLLCDDNARQDLWNRVTDLVACGPILVQDARDAGTSALERESHQRSFAAVMRDGRLLLGSGVARYGELSNFLLRLGAVSAISLEGGDASMLFAEEGAFLRLPLQKISELLVFTESAETLRNGDAVEAIPNSSPVFVNGWEIPFDAYRINGYNYFKLRDIAYVLSGTEKQFEVSWDGPRNSISLSSDLPYTRVGGELTGKGAGVRQATVGSAKVYLDGETLDLSVFFIEGNNYFKLRDLGRALDFAVLWDETARTVSISTDSGYSE